MKNIGILSLQGNFLQHSHVIKKIGGNVVFVRKLEHLRDIDALIMPGGESSAIYLMMLSKNIFYEIINLGKSGLPIMGTCAGCILLSSHIEGNKDLDIKGLGLIDMTTSRNAYGSQLESFYEKINFQDKIIDTFFIRAPKITNVSDNVDVLSKLNGYPVIVRQNKIVATTSHPELGSKTDLHEYFLSLV